MSYIISHMMMTIDGKTSGNCLIIPESEETTKQYFDMHLKFEKDAYAMGRRTYLEGYTDFKVNLDDFESEEKIAKQDYISDYVQSLKNSGKKIIYAVAYDGKGTIGWSANLMTNEAYNRFKGYKGAHIIEVLTEDTDINYLKYLRKYDISYIFAGKDENNMDIKESLRKLKEYFGIKRIILEGGSTINGAFLMADALDELSVLVAPVTGEKNDNPLFYNSKISLFELKKVESRNGVVWMNYKRK